MSPANGPWSVLGIEPTGDLRAIKRAYHVKLRVTNPEDDPAGFQQLREAYELAQQWAPYVDDERNEEAEDTALAADGEPPASQPAAAAQFVSSLAAPVPVPVPPPAPPRHVDAELTTASEQLNALERELRSRRALNLEKAHALLAQLLRADNLHRFDILELLEQQLADMLAHAIPRSDPLLETVVDTLQWADRRAEPSLPPAVHEVLARQSHVAFLDRLGSGNTEESQAWRRLSGPEVAFERWVRGYLMHHSSWPELDLIESLDVNHPELLSQLNEGNVAWWRRFAERPRLSGLSFFIWMMVSMFVALYTSAEESAAGDRTAWLWETLIYLAGFLTLGLIRIYLIEWPIVLARQRWPDGPPPLLRTGWVADCALLPLLGLWTQSIPWLAWTFAAFAVLMVPWAAIAAGPIGPLAGKNFQGLNPENSRLLRILFHNVFVGTWAVTVIYSIHADLGLPLVISVAAALSASAIGRSQQFEGFMDSTPVARQWLLGWAALLFAGGMIGVAFVTDGAAKWLPTLFIGTVICVILRRCFAPPGTSDLGSGTMTWILMSLLGVTFIRVMSGDGRGFGTLFSSNWHIQFGAVLLLVSASISLARFLWQHRPATRERLTTP